MIILALDSATEQCSAALWQDGRLYQRCSTTPQHHAAVLLEMIDGICRESGISLPQVDFIIYGQGPGSFTGVRIAVSAVQGIALGLEKQTVGVSSLASLALGALRQSSCDLAVSSIDARMGEVYLGIYGRDGDGVQPLCREQVLKPQAALAEIAAVTAGRPFAAAGTGTPLLTAQGINPAAVSAQLYPQPEDLIALGRAAFAAGGGVDAALAQPVYIRNEVTWKKISEQGRRK